MRKNRKNQIPTIQVVKNLIDALNGAEFSYQLIAGVADGSVALSQLKKREYVEIIRMEDGFNGRPYAIYMATGNTFVPAYRKAKEEEYAHDWPLLGGMCISDYPQEAVRVHRIL
jgi:hypothetical protein